MAKPEWAASLFSAVALKHPKSNCDSLVNPRSASVSYCRHNLRDCGVCVWDSIFNYPGNTARCSITLAMALIKSSKIFISIRRPHATCIINAQPKDTTTFTTHTFPSADLLHTQQPTNTCANGNGWATLHREVKGQPDCILGRHCAASTADVWCCSLTALPGSVSAGETPSWASVSQPPLRVDALPSQSHSASSIPAGSLPTLHLSCGRNAQPEYGMRFRESSVERLSPQTSLNKDCISPQIWVSECKSQLLTLSSPFPLFLPFQCIWLLVSSDHIIILWFSGWAWITDIDRLKKLRENTVFNHTPIIHHRKIIEK